MNYLLDTNLILIYSRDSDISDKIETVYHLFGDANTLAVSAVTLGELDAMIKKLKMGIKRQKKIEDMLKPMMKLSINDEAIIQCYGDIDTFSQGKLNTKKSKFTARNMGKNDVWIAATASVYDLTLVTTDKDFHHLDGEFLNLEYVDIEDFRNA
jgi:tRNA(fMet)-specific endonuclease VapC